MESFLGTVWRHLYYPSLICQLVAPMPAMALFTSIGTCSASHYPHFVQNSTCTLPMPPSVPCFWCRCSYSIICIPDWQSPHVPNCSVLMVSYEIADGQPSLSQDTSCLLPWLGQRDFLATGGGFPEGVHQPYHHVFWAICEYFLTDSCPFLLLPCCRIIMMLSCHEMLSSS